MKHNISAYNKSVLATLLFGAVAGATLASCSDETYGPDPSKDWAGTTSQFIPTEESAFTTYYNPQIGTCGDPMPYYDEASKEFRILYLQDYGVDQNGSSYHPIWAISTTDCANYTALGEILPAGAPAEQDAGVGTGCCVYDEATKTYYIYYTGHNEGCAQAEAVMRATSKDGKNYTKDMLWMLKGADYGFDASNFRDPQIFKGDDNLWHMVITSKSRFAEFTSTDLVNWTSAGGFGMTWGRTSECPDVFKMGNWWYLVYSDQSVWGRCVKYIKGESWENLREAVEKGWFPNEDEGKLDNRGFFAGKTASDGKDRYIWGWSPQRFGANIEEKNTSVYEDREPPMWGALVCHKLVQHEDGSLSFAPVPGIAAKYNKEAALTVMNKTEGVDINGNSATLTGDSHVLFSRLGYHNHISFTLKAEGDDDKFGLSFVRSDEVVKEGEKQPTWFSVNFNNPHWEAEKRHLRRMEFIHEGEGSKGFINGALSNFVPRPADNTYNIDIYNDNSVVVIYYNNVLCYTTRIYGIQKNCWSINNYGGKITVSDLKVTQY